MPARTGFRTDPHDSRIEQLRVPPNSIEAEQAVLGGLMLAPEAYDRINDKLTANDFYRRDHQLIYRAIAELAEKNRPFDAVTLGEWFESQGQMELIAGGAYLVELASTTPSAANIVAYAEIVRDKAVLRQLIEVGTTIVNDGFQPDGRESSEILEEAERQVLAIAQASSEGRTDFVTVQKALTEAFDVLQTRYASGGSVTGLLKFNNTDLAEGRNLLGRMAMAIGMTLNEQQNQGLTLDGQPPRAAPRHGRGCRWQRHPVPR